MTTQTPSTTPPTTKVQATIVTATDPSPIVLQRLSEKHCLKLIILKQMRNLYKPMFSMKSKIRFQSSCTKLSHNLLHQDWKEPFVKIEEISLRKSGSFLDHDKHIDLYNALINYIVLGEAIEKGELDLTKVLNRQRHDDEDQDPPAESEKDNKKKRKRKDSEPSKDDQDGSSKKGKPLAKTSITDKSVQAEKTVAKHTQEVPMDTEEPSFDDVVNDVD
ncbi:hypothetical protein Tco_0808646 [Tanacetum coccineum]